LKRHVGENDFRYWIAVETSKSSGGLSMQDVEIFSSRTGAGQLQSLQCRQLLQSLGLKNSFVHARVAKSDYDPLLNYLQLVIAIEGLGYGAIVA
jgi:hypothetical protein